MSRPYAPSEWQEARNERIADRRTFDDNEAALEIAREADATRDDERRARLAKNAALIAQLEKE